jgi:SAM-dependent methyltransferase
VTLLEATVTAGPAVDTQPRLVAATAIPQRAEGPLSLRERQRAQWDAVAGRIGDLEGAATTAYYRRAEERLLSRAFGDVRGRRVLKLDLWNEAFNTRILHWLNAQGAEAWGLDLSRVVAARASENARRAAVPLRLLRADIRELPLADGSFDALYTMGTIEHIDEYRQALAEVTRVLRPGGRAVIGVPNLWDPFLRPLMVWVLDRFGGYAYAPEKAFSGGELRRVVEEAGLVVRERTGILAMPGWLRMADLYFHRRGWRAQGAMERLLWPFEQIERSPRWAGRFGYLATVVAERPR